MFQHINGDLHSVKWHFTEWHSNKHQ